MLPICYPLAYTYHIMCLLYLYLRGLGQDVLLQLLDRVGLPPPEQTHQFVSDILTPRRRVLHPQRTLGIFRPLSLPHMSLTSHFAVINHRHT